MESKAIHFVVAYISTSLNVTNCTFETASKGDLKDFYFEKNKRNN